MRVELGRSSSLLVGFILALSIGAAQAQSLNPATRSPAPAQSDDMINRNAAARSRMNECGHQWSAKKKAGTAVGTWKEFFKTCLNHQ